MSSENSHICNEHKHPDSEGSIFRYDIEYGRYDKQYWDMIAEGAHHKKFYGLSQVNAKGFSQNLSM